MPGIEPAVTGGCARARRALRTGAAGQVAHITAMLRFAAGLFLALSAAAFLPASAAEPPAATAEGVEARVRSLIAAPEVTIVHFWAPWCSNCRAEMTSDGWARFISEQRDVTFVFINIWHRGQDPQPKLRDGALGGQPNLVLIDHPNPASRAAERLNTFLDLPITWVPTTWVFRDGKLRFALNYGEVRFDLLKTLVDDAREAWKR